MERGAIAIKTSGQSSSEESNADKARAALLTRLEQLCRKPVKPGRSLQPTPEAAQSKIRRLRRKHQLLRQRAKALKG
jgi:hypothetical protein